MNKKAYITPEMEVINVMAESQMMAASPNDIPVVDGEGEDVLSNDRRGSWGNLWD